MSRKSKIEVNRADQLTEIDAELDHALAKLEATSSKVDEVLAMESGDASAAPSDPEDADDGPDESEKA